MNSGEQDAKDEARIIASWQVNASPWTSAVRDGQIASRKRGTDRAVVEAVLSQSPRCVLDIGCGEGWLARALSASGIEVHGVDAVSALIDQARSSGGGIFEVATYDEIAEGRLGTQADVLVCNFSLLGKTSTEGILRASQNLVRAGGSVVIQTLHPLISTDESPYRTGWRQGSWAGFDSRFVDPFPWYFRTLGDWMALFQESGWRLQGLREPMDSDSPMPLSIIFILGR